MSWDWVAPVLVLAGFLAFWLLVLPRLGGG